MKYIVDTNVLVVANRKATHASDDCILSCIHKLRDIQKQGTLVVDDGWRILKEYCRNARSAGQPGVGDAFLKWALTHQSNPAKCERIYITPKNSSDSNFHEFPEIPDLRHFDAADRKFIAVAMAHPDRPLICQAVDTRWWLHRKSLKDAGVCIDFLCPTDIKNLAKRKRLKPSP